MREKENQIQRHFPKELILGDLTILKGSLVLEHTCASLCYLTKFYKTIEKKPQKTPNVKSRKNKNEGSSEGFSPIKTGKRLREGPRYLYDGL